MDCNECHRVIAFTDYVSNAESPMYESGFKNHIIEATASACLSYWSFPLEQADKPPEYLMKINYEEVLDESHLKPNGAAVLLSSTLHLDLYYNGVGGAEELVGSWETEKPARDFGDLPEESLPESSTGFNYHCNVMCDNYPRTGHGWAVDGPSVLKGLKPLEQTVLYAFEKMPVECEIKPEKEAVNIGRTIEITLSKFKDILGEDSREFNRIILQALEGKIVNGEPHGADPDLKVFKVGDGTVKVKYQAPDSNERKEDTIRVYKSCTVARDDLWPLAKTELGKVMAEKKIRIKGEMYEVSVGAGVNWQEDDDYNSEMGSFSVEINGSLEISKELTKGGISVYLPDNLHATYKYNRDKTPNKPRCTGEGVYESASGSVALSYSSSNPFAIHLRVQPIKSLLKGRMPEGAEGMLSQISAAMSQGLDMMREMTGGALPPELASMAASGMQGGMQMMVDRYELGIRFDSAPPQKCNVRKVECKKGEPVVKESTKPFLKNFRISIHSQMENEMGMGGQQSWASEEYSLGAIEVNEINMLLDKKPFTPKASSDGKFQVEVSWNLRKIETEQTFNGK